MDIEKYQYPRITSIYHLVKNWKYLFFKIWKFTIFLPYLNHMEYALKKSQGLFYFPRLYLQCQKQNYYGSTKMLEELFKTNLINKKNYFIILIFF